MKIERRESRVFVHHQQWVVLLEETWNSLYRDL